MDVAEGAGLPRLHPAARACASLAFVLALALPGAASAAGTVTVVVLDARTGAPIPLASVYVAALKLDLEAGDDGTVTLTGVPEGATAIAAAAAGYVRATGRVEGTGTFSTTLELRLRPRGRGQTVITSEPTWEVVERSGLPHGGSPSEQTLSRADLETSPGALGDPLRAVQKLPGVSGDEGSRAWLRVRGGLGSELQVEIDGISIGHLTHADGIVSLVHRDLVDAVTLHSAGTPSSRPGGTAGGLYLTYRDGPHDRLDGAIDLSLLAGSVMVAGEVADGHEIVAALRQSFLTAYLAAAAPVFDGPTPTVNYGETFLRYTHRSGDHRLRLTALGVADRMLFDDVNVRHRTLGGAADWRWRWREGGTLDLQIAHSSSTEDSPAEADFPVPRHLPFTDRDQRTHVRLSNRHEGDGRAVAYGVEAAARTRRLEGQFEDRRAIPAWAHLPFADLDVPVVELNTNTTWAEIALWGEGEFERILGPLGMTIGARLDLPRTGGGRPTLSPRLDLVLPLSWGMTLAGRAALVHQHRTDALVADRDLGDSTLRPERAAWFELSVDQRLQDRLFVGATGWIRLHDHLAVSDGTRWRDTGFGRALGLELRGAVRSGRLAVDASYSFGLSERTDPLTELRTPAGGDQRHEFQAGVGLEIGARRRGLLTADYTYRSGWAIGTMSRGAPDADGVYLWSIETLGDRRTQDLHRISARFEHSHHFARWRLIGSVEAVATPLGGGVVEDCPTVAQEGVAPACRTLDFLPVVMPWVGLRAEF